MRAAVSKIQAVLKEWDHGSTQRRLEILKRFVCLYIGRTGPEIEEGYSQSASLFLTRVTAWLKLTYITGTCVTFQLKTLQIFLAATAGHHFMAQFIEVGGVCTLLEIIALKQSKSVDRTIALKIATVIASAGRQYKELICECYGIRTVAECLAKSKSEETQETCKVVLQLLAQGNPKYEVQVYKSFIALLPCTSPKAQQLAIQNLRMSQKIVKKANPSVVEPLLNLLNTVHMEVQYEAIEFIRELLDFDVRDSILEGLVKALRPTREDMFESVKLDSKHEKLLKSLENAPDMKGPLPAYVKQAAAAKAIGILCKESTAVAEEFLRLEVVRNLIFACGNTELYNSQREASTTLEYLVLTFPAIYHLVKEAMGDELFRIYMSDAEFFYSRLKPVHVDVLVFNKVITSGVDVAV